MMGAASVESEISLSKLKEFIPEKRPNYIKVVDIMPKYLILNF